MGSDIAEVVDKLPDPYAFKLPLLKYKELKKLLDRISTVLPLIEAAQPPGSSGIEALGSLNDSIERAMQFSMSCSRSSKLYLAVRGNKIASKCQRSKNLLEESLSQIQTMVPHELAEEISHIMDDLTGAKFTLNSSEEEAIKAVRRFLLQCASASDLMETSEIKALQLAASMLDITSPDAIRREKNSIKKKLLEVKYSNLKEKDTLNSLLHLLKKYGHLILQEPSANGCVQHEEAIAFEKCGCSSTYSQSVEVESQIGCQHHEVQIDLSSRAIPPEEFKCPISSRLMHDPVVIASGQTFERMNIQKWFDGGNEICPKTKIKLAHLSLTPNMAMKDLISKWCMANAVTIPDPTMISEVHAWETSSTSIVSFGSSMNNLHLPVDLSNVSVGSLDSSYALDSSQSYALDSSQSYALDSSHTMSKKEEQKSNSYAKIHEIDTEYLSKLAELQWESQCKVVEDVKNQLNESDQACHSMSSDNFVRPLARFLRDALHLHDVKAQRTGSQLLSAFVRKNRTGISYLCEEAFSLLVTFLISEVTEEALGVLEFLSSDPHCKAKIAASGALTSILKMLDSDNRDCQERAIKILCNLSSNCDICSRIASLECIPKLVPFLVDSTLAGNCVIILKNLCRTDEGRVSIVETNGCVASVAALVAAGSLEEQENAVSVLLSLCSHRVQYCQLVLRTQEDVISALFDISVNGTDNGKVSARELLRYLRDVKHNDDRECSGDDMGAFRDTTNLSKERNSSKASGFLGRISIFSKPKKK
ncbi:U-box domain-containing protein 5-like isoform X1 [Carya illinoinensis]|uniref:U-box domain-containing protein n=2 Tax=Carya illinoinensis TaxID=32201 RepID=A0A8T1RHS9_CARIL|nr:U-box domain-containing protein 5-like isoform X1 [Carya illinoinensis]XP_042976889.1 U-box domain-containing protein 5-like isoform X1 [Carya illinoinensis]XP_042976898.1 U-box domain-containing protein 5-like isoform X1 [Carya illinoinensis]XP_042976904.1 U-box domain-containing protein 5-like isoform X1 [Carya illinoinensis]XP_042976911.1 U-box domain-containing protein 5-like isoform X1 [Carya illinoinensis]XP_042976918.1 U-box domain-containing protein 5-like isoform X1 [Carya illinoin